MKKSKTVVVDLPEPLLLKIAKIADEENKRTEDVIIDLLRTVVSPEAEVPPQVKPQSPDSRNDV